ncbi:uncharacterized protein UDID_08985 [Ustilago sp. UG-2017a]|nr:uncharacterized protein UDID_08985 [Ustilago sp. UG-2017a]
MRSSSLALLATLASPLLLASTATADVKLSPAANVAQAGSFVSNTINPSYAGFGIEPTDILVYTGTTSRNQLTFNLLSNLANYTSAPPHIRVGGNAGDTMIYDQSLSGYEFQQNPNPIGAGNARPSDYLIFGPDFFRAFNYLPAGTPITYGLNLAYQGPDAFQRITDQANAALQYVGTNTTGARIVSLEIGNEPDLYIDLGYRSQDWSPTDFGNEWASRAQAVYNSTLKSRGFSSNFFEVAATATTATKNGQPFRIANLVGNAAGVAIDNGIYVAGWNQHDYYYYLNVSNYQLTLSTLLDLSTTPSQFREWAGQVSQAIVTGKPYFLREMGSVGPNGIQGISETFANALWTLNFFFYAASIKVDSVQMHMTQYSLAAPWQTNYFNGTAPHVRPTYYAWAAWAQIIGPTCDSKIASISLSNQPGWYSNRLGAYGVYRADTLTSVVMLNTQPYYAYSGNPSYQNFLLSLPFLAGQTVYLSTLYADGVDSTANVTWNGISYETSTTGQPRTVNATQWTMTVGADGSLTVPVRDSEVVVASTARLGREEVNTANCQLLKSTGTIAGTATGAASNSGSSAAPTFKATTGFKSDMPLSRTAIIAIAAGGGAFLLLMLALIIWCCVRSCKKSNARKARKTAILKAPPRYDHRPLLGKDAPEERFHSYPAYHNSPAMPPTDSPMTSLSHAQHIHPSQPYHKVQPVFEYTPAGYQHCRSHSHATPAHPLPQPNQYLQSPYQNYGHTTCNGHARAY